MAALDLLTWKKNETSISTSKTDTYSPTTSSVNTYSPTLNYSPNTSITYPNYAVQISSPFSDISQSQAIRQQPQVSQYPNIPVSVSQEPVTKPAASASAVGESGINPLYLIGGAVAIVALMFLMKK